MRAVQQRFPQISTLALIAFAYAYWLIPSVFLEAPTFLSKLWGLPGAPADFSVFADGQRYAWAEHLTTGIVFTTFAAVRYFKNDRDQEWRCAMPSTMSRAISRTIRVRPGVRRFAG